MFCDRCGANLQVPVSFCPHCGRQFSAVPPPAPAVNRVARHVRNVAIAWLVYSALRVLPGFLLRSMSNWDFPFGGDMPYFVRGVVQTVGGFFVFTGVLGLIAGWGLYERRHWARILAIVLAFLNLLHPPLGTALGFYTLWVLLPAESEAEWRRTAIQ
ncbi:MAG: zinc ribbon domain-containing protein [Candidatus Solibacter sp.]